MLLKCYNRALISDREKTYLTVAISAATTSITVASTDLAPAATSSNVWVDNDYMIIGEIGQEGIEVMQVNGAVTSATSITIDREGQAGGTRHAHPIGTPVYRIDYNQVEFNRSATDATSGVAVLTTINLQLDDEFTRYEDATNTTGYGFVRFKNAATNAFSSYSDGVNYEQTSASSSKDPKTLWMLRRKVRQLLDETDYDSKLTDEMIDGSLDDKQREIAHIRLWSFYEGEKSLSSVANQFAYDIPTTVQKVHGVKFDTQPLIFISRADWEIRHFDTDQSTADPAYYSVWNNQIKVFSRPSSSAQTTALNGAITSSSTTIIVDSTSGFNRGDYYRLIIDSEVIYATASTSTTFTGCLRGQEGTTAILHLDDAVVTERDIVFPCHLEPTDLTDVQDRTAIPEPEILVYGVAIDLASLVGKENMITLWQTIFTKRIKDLENKYASKQTIQHSRIKDMSERISSLSSFEDPNRYPKSINA